MSKSKIPWMFMIASLFLVVVLISDVGCLLPDEGMQFFGLMGTNSFAVNAAYATTSGTFVYIATSDNPGVINKLLLKDFTRNATFTAGAGETFSAAANDGIHGYFPVTSTSNLGSILKIRLADMVQVGRYNGGGGLDNAFAAIAIGSRGFGYFGGTARGFSGSTASALRKIDLSTMLAVATFTAFGLSFSCSMLDRTETFGYFTARTSGSPSGSSIEKFQLSTMSRVASAPSVSSYDFRVCFMDATNDTVGYISGNGGLTQRWLLDSMTLASSFRPVDDGYISSGARVGNYVYFAQSQSTLGRIVKFNTASGIVVADEAGRVQIGDSLLVFADNASVYSLTNQVVARYGYCDPHSHMLDGSSCVQCPSGFIGCQTVSSQYCTYCVPCGPGTFSSADSASCTLCNVGTYAANAGSGSCVPCSGALLRGASVCSSLGCPRGTYEATNGSCVECPAGEYSTAFNSVSCSVCPGGTFSNLTGATSSSVCVRCAAGSYSDPGSVMCTPCQAGTYSNRAGASSAAFCLPCPAGTWSAVEGGNASDTCQPCVAGTYSVAVAAVSVATCISCPEGTYSSMMGAASASDCSVCPAGSFGNTSAATAIAACYPCPEGAYSGTGATSCTLCDEGTYGPKSSAKSAASCVSCPPGTYQNIKGATHLAMCTPCVTGTYSTAYGASTAADCTPCPLGSFNNRVGSPSPLSCALCPGGTYGVATGATHCTGCPDGTFSTAVGATDAAACMPCGVGTYSNASSSAAQGLEGALSCTPCPPGHYQNASGANSCNPCSRGTFNDMTGATSCTHCSPGSFCGELGCSTCPQCPKGFYQPKRGSEACDLCSRELSDLPIATPQSLEAVASVCAPLQHTFSINWGFISDPSILYAEVGAVVVSPESDLGTLTYDWLTVSTVRSSVVVATAVSVPSTLLSNRPVLIRVNVSQTCRFTPWTTDFKLEVIQIFPTFSLSASSAFEFSSKGEASVKACPDFEFRYSVNIGSCPDKTVIKAMLASSANPDGRTLSEVPAYIKYVFEKGILSVYGSIPREEAGALVVAVAFLDGAQYVSDSTVSVVRLDEANVPTFSAIDVQQVVACPYVRAVFTAVPAACGLTSFGASLQNGSMLPPFLSVHTTANGQVVVSGIVPEGAPSFAVRGTATVIGALSRANYSSPTVTVVRPASVSPFAVGVDASSDGVVVVPQQIVANGTQTVQVVARYSIALRLTFRLADPEGIASSTQCSSQALLVGRTNRPLASGVSEMDSVPSWLVAVSVTQSLIVFSGMPGRNVPTGERSEFFVHAFDGVSNPIVHVVVTVAPSLVAGLRHQSTNSTHNNSVLFVDVASPSPIVSVSAKLPLSLTADEQSALVCPPAGAASAVCSYDQVSGTLAAFGTVEGINKVLGGLRLASSTTQWGDATAMRDDAITFVVSDSVNPSPVVVSIPAAQLAPYDGVRLVSPIHLYATIGKPLVTSLSSNFVTPSGGAIFVLKSTPGSWFSMSETGLVTCRPRGPPGIVSGSLVVSDAYVKRTVVFDVNLSTPRSPMLVSPKYFRLPVIFAESNVVSDATIDRFIFTDPENGTLQFQLRLATSTILPSFILFDSETLQLSLSPTTDDVGSYTLELLAMSEFRSPDWDGNATSVVQLQVDLSWKDFFQQLYETIGFVTFALSAVGIPWMFRAFLYNTLCVRRYHQRSIPKSFVGGSAYVVCSRDEEGDCRALPAASIADVTIHPLDAADTTTGFVWSWFVPQYIRRLVRQQPNPYHNVANIGVPWATQTFYNDTRVVHVDSLELAKLLQHGHLRENQEYLLVATHSSWLRRGMIAVSFEFAVCDLLKETETFGEGVSVTDGHEMPLIVEEDNDDLLHFGGAASAIDNGDEHCRFGQSGADVDADFTRLDAEVCSLRLMVAQLQNQSRERSARDEHTLKSGKGHQDELLSDAFDSIFDER